VNSEREVTVDQRSPVYRLPFTFHHSPFTVVHGSGSGLVAWPVFKTASEAPSAAPVGSIPTRSRHLPLARVWLVPLLLILGGTLPALHAQAAPPPRRPAVTSDTLTRQYISPMNALWRSLLLPGWGQARLNRKLAAGIFIAWEGVTLGMSLKTRRELGYLRRTSSGRADSKRQEHEDWVVLLAFNHLFAGLEAYISAHLADFPGDLRLRAVPGGVGAAVSLPVQLR
jgi:hypothetical protein